MYLWALQLSPQALNVTGSPPVAVSYAFCRNTPGLVPHAKYFNAALEVNGHMGQGHMRGLADRLMGLRTGWPVSSADRHWLAVGAGGP